MEYKRLLPGKITREDFNLCITGDSERIGNCYTRIKVEYDEIRSVFNTERLKDSFSFSGTAFLFDKIDVHSAPYKKVGTFIVNYNVDHPYSPDDNDCTQIIYTPALNNNDYWLSVVYNLIIGENS
ncbi:hypothetical protein [Enterocloster bolteae]|jgi:hypothetical protein|uniref:Uncharacterized protein n=1 Tax=Enterocloster bolteae TaxID=208479 RepID=A0A412ZBW2_9FIRM|nr:hypothetical protein [Enterocloster bolteae]RGV77557.1 hypothetical protein DWW02_07805 [Enterocloster bolteae]